MAGQEDLTAASFENDISPVISLDGEWQFTLADSPPRTLGVPSAWEAYIADKITDGPAVYRRAFAIPESWSGKTIILEADAVGFDCAVRVNGEAAGGHRGMWSPFQIDVTPFVRPGGNEIEIEIWKPGARWPLRESLAGFLPDVCTTFGGPWQSIRLRAHANAAINNLAVYAAADGQVAVNGEVAFFGRRLAVEVWIDISDPRGRRVARARAKLNRVRSTFAARLAVRAAEHWRLHPNAALYSATVSVRAGRELLARARRRFGFRHLQMEGEKVSLNGSPLSLRGVLDWGWDAERICPALPPGEVRAKFAKARALGFNMIKLCLFVPDEATFDAADEEGMLLWLEMPLWLPRVTGALRDLARREYRAVFRRAHHHPSIVIVSLGCELNAEADAEFLRALHDLAREFFPDALHCSNSGSAEAYGGAATPLSDFYDYHFYTDPHFFPPLVDHFSRAYLPRKPWIYGEFCDADTLRDFNLIEGAWWLRQPTRLERDDFLAARDYRRRLAEGGIADGGQALTRTARRQATAIRKFILEHVRSRHATGGYVLTGWTDTPITTSGVVDDHGDLKFDPAEWRLFNADRVLTIDRERRRRWVGGDRPARKEPFVWWQGERAEIHMLLSNGAQPVERGRLQWRVADASGAAIASGTAEADAAGGEVAEIGVLAFTMPQQQSGAAAELTLSASLSARGRVLAENYWRLWAVPRLDPASRQAREKIARELNTDLLMRVRGGQTALLWLSQPDERFTASLPFWREAIHVFAPHPFWDRVPHAGYADMRFFSVATDFAVDPRKLSALLESEAQWNHVWRRFDTRQMAWADYLLEVKYGLGRLFVATLRFEGGLGHQPDSFETNPMGSWLLRTLITTISTPHRKIPNSAS